MIKRDRRCRLTIAEEKELIKVHQLIPNMLRIARAYGINEKTVRKVLNAYDIDTSKANIPPPPEEQTAIRLYQAGLTAKVVGEQLGYSDSWVYLALRKHNIPGRSDKAFTPAEEQIVISMYESGVSAAKIAEHFGLKAAGAVSRVLRENNTKLRNRPYLLDESAFDDLSRQEAVYWWGFIYADGCVTGKNTLSITLDSKDYTHIQKLYAFLKTNKKPYIYYQENGYGGGNRVTAMIHSDHIATRLRQLGVIVDRPSVQPVIDHLPDDMFSHWVRGYFDGDGCARKGFNASISLIGQEDLLLWIRSELYKRLGTNPHLKLYKHKHSDIYTIDYGGIVQAVKIRDWLYKDAAVFMSRKKEIADSWFVLPGTQGRKRGWENTKSHPPSRE